MKQYAPLMQPQLNLGMLLTLSLTGCDSTRSVTFLFSDYNCNPVTNIVAEMYCPASGISKFMNPVGNFYHPLSLSRTDFPNPKGIINYENISEDVWIYITVAKSVKVEYIWKSQTNKVVKSFSEQREGKDRLVFFFENGKLLFNGESCVVFVGNDKDTESYPITQ